MKKEIFYYTNEGNARRRGRKRAMSKQRSMENTRRIYKREQEGSKYKQQDGKVPEEQRKGERRS